MILLLILFALYLHENVAKYAGVQRDIFLYTVEGTPRERVHGDGAGKRTERGNKIKSVNVSSRCGARGVVLYTKFSVRRINCDGVARGSK